MSLEGKSVEEIQALAELANGLASDPKTRNGFLRLTKIANPSTSIPEVDIPAQLGEMFKPHLEKLDALAKRAEKEDSERAILRRREELMAEGVDAKDIPKIEKLMVDKGIANHKTAVEHMKLESRAAEPTPSQGFQGTRKFDQPKLPDFKAFGGDQKAYSYATAYQVIDELRGRKPVSQ